MKIDAYFPSYLNQLRCLSGVNIPILHTAKVPANSLGLMIHLPCCITVAVLVMLYQNLFASFIFCKNKTTVIEQVVIIWYSISESR